MLIKKLISLCAKSKMIQVYHTDSTKYISEGHVVYPIYQDFEFNSISLCEIYDLDKDKVGHVDLRGLPEGVSGQDTIDAELQCTILPIQIYRNGELLLALESASGISFIAKKYLSPLSDTDQDTISLYERRIGKGFYFVAKVGFELAAIILPTEILSDKYIEDITHFAAICEKTHIRRGRHDGE
ncbi:MAG: hypothetical protein ACI4RU_00845 [Acutalibacteraceae bacterium]